MSDLVVTVRKAMWDMWFLEGDAVGTPETGEEWAFFLDGGRPPIGPGDRLYIVAWNRLRGYAPVTRLAQTDRGWAICRKGGAVAVTIRDEIKGFRGFRKVWWTREQELPFPRWQIEGVPL